MDSYHVFEDFYLEMAMLHNTKFILHKEEPGV